MPEPDDPRHNAEQTFAHLVAEGRGSEAAAESLRQVLISAARSDLTLAGAWMHRARRVLRDIPDEPVHGYLIYAEAQFALAQRGDATVADEAAEKVDELAALFDDPTLACFAGVLHGLADLHAGRTEAGFAALEEAMLPVVAGWVDPLWAGDIYCSVIHICEQLADLARMRAWTDALARWAQPISEQFRYFDVTRIHQLQLLSAEGEWDAVAAELETASSKLVGAHGWVAGAGFRELGDIRRLRGDFAGAAQAYARARDQGIDPQPGEALLHQAQGDSSEALELLRVAIGEQVGLSQALLLLPAVEVAIVQGDVRLAERLTADLANTAQFYSSAGLVARAEEAQARVLLAQGRPAEARPGIEAAGAVYRQQRHRYAIARIHEALAEVDEHLGNRDAAEASRATARAMYQRLGARSDAARLMRDAQRPGALTPREQEVLICVASGATNHEVAEQLCISAKTVGRHLANIYLKLDVTTRTAAAAWAHDHQLA